MSLENRCGNLQQPLTNILFIATSQVPSNKGTGRALAIETLGSFLKKTMPQEVHMDFIDLQYEKNPLQRISSVATDPVPDILAISVRYGTYEQMDQILKLLENTERFQKTDRPFVVIGGITPSFMASEIVQNHPFATVVRGEGELAMLKLAKTVRAKGSLYEIPGLTFFDHERNEIISNTPRNLPLSETSSGLIITDLLSQLKDRGGIVWMQSSRGCPFICSFCSVSSFREITGNHGATRREIRPVEDVLTELKSLYDLGIRHFVFGDDEMLFGNEEEYKRWYQLADGIKNIGNDITFFGTVRSDVVWNSKDEDGGLTRRQALHHLVEAGLTQVYIGFESGSPTQLKRYRKGLDPETHLKAVAILREEGILVGGGFIMFDPLMNLDEILENVAFIRKAELISPHRKDYIGDVFDKLRLQRGSEYLSLMEKANLLKNPIPGTLFFDYEFRDPNVREIADICTALAAEVDDFFEALKNSVFAKVLADEKTGCDTEETKSLNRHLINLRLLDLSLLEELVLSSKEATEQSNESFQPAILNFKNRRKKIIRALLNDMETGKISDPNIVQVLTTHITRLPDFNF